MNFFGNFGRDYGLFQSFTDNPKFLPEYINECRLKKEPCFISVQPRNFTSFNCWVRKTFL